jgi:hypothetical protein
LRGRHDHCRQPNSILYFDALAVKSEASAPKPASACRAPAQGLATPAAIT